MLYPNFSIATGLSQENYILGEDLKLVGVLVVVVMS